MVLTKTDFYFTRSHFAETLATSTFVEILIPCYMIILFSISILTYVSADEKLLFIFLLVIAALSSN